MVRSKKDAFEMGIDYARTVEGINDLYAHVLRNYVDSPKPSRYLTHVENAERKLLFAHDIINNNFPGNFKRKEELRELTKVLRDLERNLGDVIKEKELRPKGLKGVK